MDTKLHGLPGTTTSQTVFTLLFVDDEPDIVDSLRRSFRKAYTVLTATSGNEALEVLKTQNVDLIISDQRMPGMTGDALLAMAKELQPDAIRILLTGYSDLESLVKCVNEAGIYKYMTKPWEPEMLRLTVGRALEHLDMARKFKLASKQIKEAYLEAITMLSVACEGKDETTSAHLRRVQRYTEALARELGQTDEEAQHMGAMSILHDIGKLGIPDSILKKPGKLDEGEWHIMKGHAAHGVHILGSNPFYAIAREIAGSHHENWDGTGYPLQLKGEEIPLSARIVRVADVFDALTTQRPYKKAWSIERALAYMYEQEGTQFDPKVIQAFSRLHEVGAVEKIMHLNNSQEQVKKV